MIEVEIGKNSFVPDARLYPELVQYTSKIYDKFRTNETDTLVVAQLLGHKSISGAFNAKTALLSSYSLIERRAGKIKVTEIGRKIVFPANSKERYDGVKEAILKISLWQRLYDEFSSKGADLPGNFWADLARIADLAPEEAKNKADWVAKAFATDLSYLKSLEKQTDSPGVQQQQVGTRELPVPAIPSSTTVGTSAIPAASLVASGQIYFSSPDDKIQLSVPRSARHIGMLKTFVEDALKVIEEELIAEARLITERNKVPKTENSNKIPVEA